MFVFDFGLFFSMWEGMTGWGLLILMLCYGYLCYVCVRECMYVPPRAHLTL